MAKALDRVKAAEAKYTAMAGTAEKLESTLKNFKGTADLCYAAMRELHREIKKDQKDQRWAFWGSKQKRVMVYGSSCYGL